MFEPQTYAILMLVAFFVMLMIGVPVATTLATVGFIFGYLGFGDSLFSLLPARIYGIVAGYQWMAIPLFVFMGVMLEKSRLADDLLDVMGHIAGGLRGGPRGRGGGAPGPRGCGGGGGEGLLPAVDRRVQRPRGGGVFPAARRDD